MFGIGKKTKKEEGVETTEKRTLDAKDIKKGHKEAQKKQKKQAEEGSRFTALILLIITMLAGLFFYFQGSYAGKGMNQGQNSDFDLGGSSTFIIE